MMKAIGLIAMVLILGLSGCSLGGSGDPTPTPAAPPATLPAIQAEIASLRADVDAQGLTIASNTVAASQSGATVDITPLEVGIASLDAQIIALTDRVALVESQYGVTVSDNGTIEIDTPTTWSPVRWRYDIEMEYSIASVTWEGEGADPGYDETVENEIKEGISVEVDDVDPRTIKEEDLYDIEILVFNGHEDWAVDLEDVVFMFTLRPDNYAYLDEDMTYLDSDTKPYLDWDASFMVRERESEDVTRRVEFESSECSIEIDEDDYTSFDLVLELYYG